MAKFAIVMPATGSFQTIETIVEADAIYIHPATKKTTVVRGENDAIVSVIPQGALVYRVAEKESKPENANEIVISRLKKRISMLSEVVEMKDKANNELDSLLDGKDETIEMQSDQIKALNREIEILKCELKEEKERAVKLVKGLSESLKNSWS